jgi:hypothetical protein
METPVTFRLQIDCNTVAFGDQPELHLADLLRGIANTLQYVGSSIEHNQKIRTPVCDVNGNDVGTWSILPAKPRNRNPDE